MGGTDFRINNGFTTLQQPSPPLSLLAEPEDDLRVAETIVHLYVLQLLTEAGKGREFKVKAIL